MLQELANSALLELDARQFRRDHVSSHVSYDDTVWEPGNVSCWQTDEARVRGLSFDRCCSSPENQTWRLRRRSRRHGDPDCWAALPGLSFRGCCGSEAHKSSFPPPPVSQYRFRAVVAMTTTPTRMSELSEVLTSLVLQTRKPDMIYLSVPFFFSRSWLAYDHPWWYANMDDTIAIVRCEQDFRSNSNLLCMLQHEPAPDTRILVVDDDQMFHPRLLERMLAISERSPGAMVGASSYHEPGITCHQHDARGFCIVPNLIHSTYGLLYQRRFFDAGVMNFAAPAEALVKSFPPGHGLSTEYIRTCCMLEANVWWEANLASKGIPRVFLKSVFEVKTIADLAYEVGALTSAENARVSQIYFDRRDPKNTAAALDTCTDALGALWGPSLWPARPRRVAAFVHTAGSGPKQLSELLAGIGWWRADHVYSFVCSGRSLQQWHRELTEHGGLAIHLHYLHMFNSSSHVSDASFVSELFDFEAFIPSPQHIETDPSGFPHYASIVAAPHSPGRPAAGSRRPLADVVELCPGQPAPAPAPVELSNCGDYEARVLLHTCHGQPHERLHWTSAGGYAGVVCWSKKRQWCFSALMPRNRSWAIGQHSVGQCLAHSATYYHARRTCEILDAKLPTVEQAVGCCILGCLSLARVWIRSETVPQDCFQPLASPPRQVWPEGPASAEEGFEETAFYVRKEMAVKFLSTHEEAKSTVVEWI